ncbi:hypothetical protein GCM10025859_09290 [Alicyclobacillus fastidiosus]|nr:hypothetical protein GCM10025859_09290 [Alicyclobacillus fastidiosus]
MLAAYKYAKVTEWDSDLVLAKSLTVKGLRGHSYGAVEMAINVSRQVGFQSRFSNLTISGYWMWIERCELLLERGSQIHFWCRSPLGNDTA